MAETPCPKCFILEQRIQDLEEQNRSLQALVEGLHAKLNTNSKNSSLPPSANPLNAPKPVQKKKTKRKRGGQKGHPPHLKQLFPPERVQETEVFRPSQCEFCHAPLPEEAGPADPQPKRFQNVEVLRFPLQINEYQAHARTCPQCGKITSATIPQSIRAHTIGPRLTATLSYLTGSQGMSKRGVEEFCEVVLGVPISLGTVANMEQEVSAALAPAHEEAAQAVRQAEVKHVDETSWKLWGKLCWLWTAATLNIVIFVIHGKRSAAGLKALLGEKIHGFIHSDRWGVYKRIPVKFRQLCWAHLKRDFQKVVDGGGQYQYVGRRGLRIVKEVFAAWHLFTEGKITRQDLATKIEPIRSRLTKALYEGAYGDDARVARFCANVLDLEEALWTFVDREGMEPTNNFMERQLRPAVLWRRRSFGCNSAKGCRFVERLLTVVQTCRLRNKNSLDYFYNAIISHRKGLPCPTLLAD